MSTDDTLRRILQNCKTIAVVGLSPEWHRPSHFVAKYMQEQGYRIIPVNPKHQSILGERCYARLEDIPEPVDMVDVFRRPEDVPPIAASAVAIGAKCLWQQLGVASPEADNVARAAGRTPRCWCAATSTKRDPYGNSNRWRHHHPGGCHPSGQQRPLAIERVALLAE